MLLSVFVLCNLLLIGGQNAAAQPSSSDTKPLDVAPNQSIEDQKDFMGYWKRGDNQILYFTHKGVSLVSHQTNKASGLTYDAAKVDFTATV